MKKCFKLCLIFIAGACILSIGLICAAFIFWGSYDAKLLKPNAASVVFLDKNDQRIHSHIGTSATLVSLEDLPNYVSLAFLAAEDQEFYEHFGINPKRIVSALLYDIRTRSKAQGASTITQQLIKLTHLGSEKTIDRKLKEAYYAVLLEQDFSKEEILEMYLNTVYFGAGAYGLEAAANTYFSCTASELSPAQSACLAAILKAPTYYAPHLDYEANRIRKEYILDEMDSLGYLSAQEVLQAKSELIVVTGKTQLDSAAQWYLDQAAMEACSILDLSFSELSQGNYVIKTGFDPSIQLHAQNLLSELSFTMSGQSAQCAVVVLDQCGIVSACIGGDEYETQFGFNRAVDSLRQPGSALKPLAVYAPALEAGLISPATMLDDRPTAFGTYMPSNFAGIYYGPISVRTSFSKSLNIPAVSILSQMGIESSIECLRTFGIPTMPEDAYLPLAIGSMYRGVTPLSLCSAYLAFINDGLKPEPRWIESIHDGDGRLLYQRESNMTEVLRSDTAALVLSMMQTAASEGTAKRLAAWGYPCAAKTGTVGYDDLGNRDAWCVALTPNHVFTVWVGFDETTPDTYLDNSITGSSVPTQYILDLLCACYPQGDGEAFSHSDKIVRLDIDDYTRSQTGEILLASEYTPDNYRVSEVFSINNAPNTESSYWNLPEAPDNLMLQDTIDGGVRITFQADDTRARYRIFRSNGMTANEIGVLEGKPKQLAVFYDHNLQWLQEYQYYVTAEHALAVDHGMTDAVVQSPIVTYRVPLFSPFLGEKLYPHIPELTIPQ